MEKVNQEERAYRAWDVLTRAAANQATITYKELGDQLKVHHRTCRYFLDHIQNYCLDNKLPPLTIVVVNQEGTVGNGFTAWDTNNLAEGMRQVYEYNWAAYYNPFTYASDGSCSEDIVKLIINKDITLADVYSRIKVRGVVQSLFREALLKAYHNKCAICGFPYTEALEASHIVPWSLCSPEDKLSVNNGLLLCSNHHKLFDRGIVTISEDYVIHSSLADFKSNILGKRLRLPNAQELRPSKAHLLKRNQLMSNS